MRRPDLPLILIVIATGVALVLFAGDTAPQRAGAGFGPPSGSPDAVEDFFEDFDPVFIDCFGDVEPATPVNAAAGDAKTIVDSVAEQVERLRELRFGDAVNARFLSPGKLRGEVGSKAEKELPVAGLRKEEQVLKELGALPPGADLEEITTEALGSQVGGLYDPKSGELFVQSEAGSEGRKGGGKNPDLGADELITLAHELDHALVDQALGLRDRPGDRDEVDRRLAYASLVEGEATLLMQLYALRHIRISDQLELGQSSPGRDEFAKLPDYLQRSLIFPYLEGLRFACHRFTDGGWRAVDRAYERPPAATSQVIFPDRYRVIEPFDAQLPGRPGPGWSPATSREFGAAELEWLFRAPGGDPAASLPEPREQVFSWAGGALELWRRGDAHALAVSLVELPDSPTSLCSAVGDWYEAAWPDSEVSFGDGNPVELEFSEPGRAAVLICEGVEVRLGVAPDRAAAFSLAA